MSNDTEQKITRKDLQSLIEESNRHEKWKNASKIARIIATPVIITFVSMFVTWRINIQQSINTERITEKQIESAQIIAKANRDNFTKISESNQRIERLTHIKEIFKTFLNEETKLTDEKIETRKMRIISLEVYKEDALLFLLNIRNHYQEKAQFDSEQKEAYDKLIKQANKSIFNILLNSQVDVSGRSFMKFASSSSGYCESFEAELRKYRAEHFDPITGKRPVINGQKPFIARYDKLKFNKLNLRKQKYKNYNFSDCSFLSVNLYSADFSSCTLKNNLFVDVDLQEASFSGSNLSGSIFLGSNLKKADLRYSLLDNVVFVNPILNKKDADDKIKSFCKENGCCELEGARFSLGSLLLTAGPPFNIFDIDKNKNEGITEELREEQRELYIDLLMYHRQSIDDMAKAANEGGTKEKEKLDKLMKNTDIGSQEEFIQRLEEAEKRTKILATPATAHKYTFFSKR